MSAFVVKFKNRNVEPEAKKVDCSNRIITIYKLSHDKDMKVQIVEKKKINIYEEIQSHSNEVDFERILKTIELTENPLLFASNQSKDMDLTKMPSNLADAHKVVKEGEALEESIKKSDYFKAKGIPFDEFVKNYNALDHAAFLKAKYSKKVELKKEESK